MRSTNITLACVTLLALAACGWWERGPTKQEQVDAFNEAGWELFTEDEFSDALVEFKDGLELDPVNISGNVGRGWSLLMLDDEDQDTIVAALEVGAASPSAEGWQEHSWCGLAVVKLNQLEYSDADSLTRLVLAADSGYVFTYHDQIDWLDMLVIQAQALFITTDHAGAWQAIKRLLAEPDSPVSLPNGDLNPADPSTWNVNGTTFALYEMALAEVIEILANKYRLE
ncbi:MAG: hypothetical protein JSU77_07830 [Fidelibacterota bacterium]|nr:MAG: hypothetical protein JSU77_07830 [Candidatus Neomarinimicrobiota bacterium]